MVVVSPSKIETKGRTEKGLSEIYLVRMVAGVKKEEDETARRGLKSRRKVKGAVMLGGSRRGKKGTKKVKNSEVLG